MTLGLGTVQFGMKYGVTNTGGPVPFDEVVRILTVAKAGGVTVLDTAPSYGTSEEVLGRALPKGHAFKVVTKTPHFKDATACSEDVARDLEESFGNSLRRLRQESIYGLIIHRPGNLLDPFADAMWGEMRRLRSSGKVQKIGASVYNAQQVDTVLEKYDPDLVQLPLNVLDQRLIRSGHLKRLKERDVEIHVRSVFLQGVLVTPPDQVPGYFDPLKAHLRRYHSAVRSHRLSPVQAALAFARGLEEIDVVLCGVTGLSQFEDVVENSKSSAPAGLFSDFAIEDERMLNPLHWKVA